MWFNMLKVAHLGMVKRLLAAEEKKKLEVCIRL